MKLLPVGSKLIIEPKERINHKTEAGIEIIQNELAEGTVIEVSEEYSKFFAPGDVVLYSNGAGHGEYYKGRQCMWIDGRSVATGGDVWAIIQDDKNVEDKGDSL